MNKKIIIGAVAVLIVIAVVMFAKGGFTKSSTQGQVSTGIDAIDTVVNFYDKWLLAVKNPTTADPSLAVLAKSPVLSKELSARLVSAPNATPDPVLCQKVVPENITTRRVYETADKAEVLVTSRDKKVTEQAIIELTKFKDGWMIMDIQCAAGEFAPKREFSFEKEGFLLKASVPKPFDPKNWHLVFEDNGKLGNVVPLFFDKDSQCTSLEGVKAVCKPDQFKETAKVSVHAQLSERGATVKKMEFIK